MNDVRCVNCGKKLAEEQIKQGELIIKCPRCRKINKKHFFCGQKIMNPLVADNPLLAKSQH